MGKYSIDSFEAYPLLTLRPERAARAPVNPGYGLLAFRDGFVYAQGGRALGRVTRTHDMSHTPAAADDLLPLVPLDGSALPPLPSGSGFGLLLDVRSGQVLDIARDLARNGLQRTWKRNPVYALLSEQDEALIKELQRWHVRAANLPAVPGLDVQLRRVTLPRTLSSGGALPLRLWLCNAGTCPLYERAVIHVKLSGEGSEALLAMRQPDDSLRKLGDIVLNEVLHLPGLQCGAYTLSLRIELEGGGSLALNMAANPTRGFYPLGQVHVDNLPRPELFHIWNSYYPEGYYPLEDPQKPKQG